MIRLYTLGQLRIEVDGNSVHIPTRKATAILLYLALEPQQHQRDSLAAFFWPDGLQSRQALRRELSRLNKAIGNSWSHTTRDTVQIESPIWVDAIALQEAIQQEAWQTAVNLYHNSFLHGFTLPDSPAFDHWQAQIASQTEQMALQAGDGYVAQLVEKEDWQTAVSHLNTMLTIDSLRESTHQTLIHLYAQQGERSKALHHYGQLQTTLQQELGIEPSTASQQLHQQIQEGTLTPTPPPIPLSGKKLRYFRWFTFTFTSLMFLFTFNSWQNLQQSRQERTARQLVRQIETSPNSNTSLWLAIEATERDPQQAYAIYQQLQNLPLYYQTTGLTASSPRALTIWQEQITIGTADGSVWWGDTKLGQATSPVTAITAQDGWLITGHKNGTWQRWGTDGTTSQPVQAHEGDITAVLFTTPHTIATASRDHTIRLWDVANQTTQGQPLLGHENVVAGLAIRNSTLASVSWDGTLRLWDIDRQEQVGEATAVGEPFPNSVTFAPDGTLYTVGRAGTITHWQDGKPTTYTTSHPNWLMSVTLQGNWLLTRARDGSVWVWSTQDQQPLELTKEWAEATTFLTENQVVSVAENGRYTLWNLTQPSALYQQQTPITGNIIGTATLNGTLHAGTSDGRIWTNEQTYTLPHTIQAWQTHPEGILLSQNDEVWLWQAEQPRVIVTHPAPVTLLAYQAPYVLSASLDGTLHLTNLNTGAIYTRQQEVTAIALTPDGAWLGQENGRLSLHQLPDLIPMHGVESRTKEAITAIDGIDNWVFTGQADGSLTQWELRWGKLESRGYSYWSEQTAVSDIAFSENYVAISYWGGKIEINRLPDGEYFPTLTLNAHQRGVSHLRWQQNTLISSSWDDSFIIWQLDPQAWLTTACEVVSHPAPTSLQTRYQLEKTLGCQPQL